MPVLSEGTETTTAAAPMTPGTYLRKRREAAGLGIDDVANMIRPDVRPHQRPWLERSLHKLESDEYTGLHLDLVELERGVFRFDVDVYHALLVRWADPAAETPVPQICRQCGCTWHDACEDGERGPCGWVDPDLCSHCLRKDLDDPNCGITFAAADVVGDECPDCGGELGPVFGAGRHRTCSGCDTTYLGAGQVALRSGGKEAGDVA